MQASNSRRKTRYESRDAWPVDGAASLRKIIGEYHRKENLKEGHMLCRRQTVMSMTTYECTKIGI